MSEKDDMVTSVCEALSSAFMGEVRIDLISGNSIWLFGMAANERIRVTRSYNCSQMANVNVKGLIV